MTEVLPVTDVTVAEIDAAGDGRRRARRPPPARRRRAHQRRRRRRPRHRPAHRRAGRARGDRRPGGRTRRTATTGCGPPSGPAPRDPGWHRTGDVGRLDAEGRLWIGGRLGHVITTPDGPLAPVRVEQAVQQLPARAPGRVRRRGTARDAGRGRRRGRRRCRATGLADLALTAAVRAAPRASTSRPSSCVASLPVDIRHRSKIDRAALAGWAGSTLAGRAGRSTSA